MFTQRYLIDIFKNVVRRFVDKDLVLRKRPVVFYLIFIWIPSKGSPPGKKNVFFWALPKLPLPPPSPQFGQLVPLFLDVKNDILAHITEPSNDDYDNDVYSDNCDDNFGTSDDFGVNKTIKDGGVASQQS